MNNHFWNGHFYKTKGPVINYGEGGGYEMGILRVRNFPRSFFKTGSIPPPFYWVQTICASPFRMAEISSFHRKTTPKCFCPPPPLLLSMAKTCSALPLFRMGKNSLYPPPSRVVCPPPPSTCDHSPSIGFTFPG